MFSPCLLTDSLLRGTKPRLRGGVPADLQVRIKSSKVSSIRHPRSDGWSHLPFIRIHIYYVLCQIPNLYSCVVYISTAQVPSDHLLRVPVPALQGHSRGSEILRRQQGLIRGLPSPLSVSAISTYDVYPAITLGGGRQYQCTTVSV